MKKQEIMNLGRKYSLQEITIVPKVVSEIRTRKECIPLTSEGMLPIFTAPMASIVNMKNYDQFVNNKIQAILPRSEDLCSRVEWFLDGKWVAFGIEEFINEILNNNASLPEYGLLPDLYACIDVANGHMTRLINLAKEAVEFFSKYGSRLHLMVGNIANPETYKYYAEAGIEYCRVSIGSGQSCLTSTQTGIHYPQASLLEELNKIKTNKCKIVLDGGIHSYSDAIKALAIGADYVMIGTLFGSLIEASGRILTSDHYLSKTTASIWFDKDDLKQKTTKAFIKKYGNLSDCEILDNVSNFGLYVYFDFQDIVDPKDKMTLINNILKLDKIQLEREVYGMSTRTAQKQLNPNSHVLKTTEGKSVTVRITTCLEQWTDNLISYLKSTMSYCNSRTLDEFIGKQDYVVIGPTLSSEISLK